MSTHENILFSCFGGLSNTGLTSTLACLEVVKELGLEKVALHMDIGKGLGFWSTLSYVDL
jgi:hypothetical protein